MLHPIRTGFGVLAVLLASACGQQGSENIMIAQPEEVESNLGDVATPSTTGPLSVYVGKHPSETVDGTRFLDEPAVKAAVAASVTDAAVRDFVFKYDGPDAPIAGKDGRILAWGCERHNCGYHNWSISITPDGASADVCFYHDDDSADGPSTWYLAGGGTEQRPGNCPSD